MFSNGAMHCQQIHNLYTSLEKTRKDNDIRRQFNKKPSITPGCPGPHKATVCNVIVRLSSTHLGELHRHELLNCICVRVAAPIAPAGIPAAVGGQRLTAASEAFCPTGGIQGAKGLIIHTAKDLLAEALW